MRSLLQFSTLGLLTALLGVGAPAHAASLDCARATTALERTTCSSQADAIAQCDAAGAHPDDPEAVARGVPDDRLDAGRVIRTCESAIGADTQAPRLHFQLARGYLQADRVEDGTEHLVAAAEQGHGAALAYLADLHVAGAPGIDADPALAYLLYERAAESGFRPAAAILKEFEDKTEEFAKSEAEENQKLAYTPAPQSPPSATYVLNIPNMVLERKLDQIESNEAWVKEYLFNIADNFHAICENEFSKRDIEAMRSEVGSDNFNIGQNTVAVHLMGDLNNFMAALKNPQAFIRREANPGLDAFDTSMNDTRAFLQTYPCGTPEIKRLFKNIKSYVLNEEAPLPPAGAIMNACLKDPLPSRYSPSEFCSCFVGTLRNSLVSQKNRSTLASDFKATARKIMAIDANTERLMPCQRGF